MSVAELAPQEQKNDNESVILIIDTLQHDAGFDSAGPVPEKLAKFEGLVQQEFINSESNTVSIVAGNTALTIAAVAESVGAGAEEIEVVDPDTGYSVSFNQDGTLHNLETEGAVQEDRAGKIEISLGHSAITPAGVEVFPVEFTDEGVQHEGIIPISLAKGGSIPKNTPDLHFSGEIPKFSPNSITHFDTNDPIIGVLGGAAHWAYLVKQGIAKGSLEVVTGGGPRQLNRVIVGSTDKGTKVRLGDVAYGGGD